MVRYDVILDQSKCRHLWNQWSNNTYNIYSLSLSFLFLTNQSAGISGISGAIILTIYILSCSLSCFFYFHFIAPYFQVNKEGAKWFINEVWLTERPAWFMNLCTRMRHDLPPEIIYKTYQFFFHFVKTLRFLRNFVHRTIIWSLLFYTHKVWVY